jgi:hypothetical protein
MNDRIEEFGEFLRRHGFNCGVIAAPTDQHLVRVGPCDDNGCSAAVHRDFFDAQTIIALAKYLQGKMLPQISGQGDYWSLAGLLPSGEVISIYGRSPGDVRVQYEISNFESIGVGPNTVTRIPGNR